MKHFKTESGIIVPEEKWVSVLEKNRHPSFDVQSYIERDNFRRGISWHIPTESLLDLLVRLSPIVSVGSGLGYTESLAIQKGADIKATDARLDGNGWCDNKSPFCPIEKMDAREAVSKNKDKNVFMAWPPYDHPMAFEVAEEMQKGTILIYVGESGGGCTGDDKFFKILFQQFIEIETEAFIPSWQGIYDEVRVYKKM